MTRIKDLLDRYTDYLKHERKLSTGTLANYLSDLRKLDMKLNKDVELIEVKDLRAIMRQMGKHYKPATIRRTFHGFGTFWRWLWMEEIVSEIIPHKLTLPKKDQTAPKWLTADELRQLFDTPGATEHDELAFKLLAWLGLRPSEVCKLRVADIKKDTVVIRETKGKHDRTLPLPDELAKTLAAFTSGRAGSEYVFGGGQIMTRKVLGNTFRRHVERAGFQGQGITPKTLRHSFATHMVKTAPPAVVRDLMGHQNISTLNTYLHASSMEMRAALEHHPLKNDPV